jgi:acetyl esterase/lipase
VVAASYRTRYKAKWPAQLDDVEAAFDYARSHAAELGLKPDAYAITGGSAGSTEAAWLSIRKSPACTVLMSSPLNFTTFRNDAIRDVLGGYDPRSASPVFAVRGGMAPTVLIHGTHDPIVPFYQSEQYEKALQKAGNSVQLWPYDGGHGNMPPALQERQKTFILSCLGVS